MLADDVLYQIDNEETQNEVEKMLRQYRTYMLTVPESKMPSVTSKFTLEMPNFSHFKRSAVESAAIENADDEYERQKFIIRISKAMRKLSYVERQLIILKYLQIEPMYNYEIYTELKMGRSKFYRCRANALYTLALSLGVAKYIDQEDKS